MLRDVRERLGDDVVRRRLDLLGQPFAGQSVELDGDRRPVGEGHERGAEPAFGQRRGMDSARDLAQLLEGVPELVARVGQHLEDVARPAVLEPCLREPERDGDRDEALLSSVVEIALEPPSLLVARGDEARPGGCELSTRLLVRERERHQARERAESLLSARCKRVRGHERRRPPRPKDGSRR